MPGMSTSKPSKGRPIDTRLHLGAQKTALAAYAASIGRTQSAIVAEALEIAFQIPRNPPADQT